MARTAPVPNFPAIPGMNPGIFVMGGGSGNGGSGPGGGKGNGKGGGGKGSNGGNDAKGGGKGAPDPNRYPECGTAAHPVDVITGRAFTHPIEDVVLAGPLPLYWHRVYSTAMAERDMGLGWGWGHSLGWAVEVRRRKVVVWNDQGVAIEFPALDVGEEVIGPWGWLLRREAWGYLVDADDGVVRRFAERVEDGDGHGESERHGFGEGYRLSAIEDHNGNRIALSYQEGRLVEVLDSAGRRLRVESTRDGHIAAVSVQNALARGQWIELVRYRHDEGGHLIEVTDADGFSYHYAYDDEHRLVRDTDRTGLTFHFVYDTAGRCVESWGHYSDRADPSLAEDVPAKLADGVTPARGIHHAKLDYYPDGYTEVTDSQEVRRFFGNRFGLLDKAVAGGAVMSCTYSEQGFLLSRTDEEGHTTTFERDGRGRIVKETDPLGRVTVTVRDEAGRPIACIDPAGGTMTIVRDGRGNEVAVTDEAGATTHYAYDARGLLTHLLAPNGGRTAFNYDAHGNRIAATLPNGAVWRWAFDALGRRLSETNPLGEATGFAHSHRGDLLLVHHAGDGVTRYEYDGEQHLTDIVDPEGRSTCIGWGGYHKVVSRTLGNGETVRLRYDREGHLVEVWNERGERHALTYDPSGLLIEERTFDGTDLFYRHDLCGRVVHIDSGPESVVELGYNAAGELVKRSVGGAEHSFEYNLRGELTRATSPAGEFVFERDAVGRLVGETQVVGGDACSVQITRDVMGARVGRTTSRGHTMSIERDAFGLRRRTTLDGSDTLLHVADALGRETRTELPGGGVIETGYGVHGRLSGRRVRAAGAQAPIAPGEPAWVGRERGVTVDRWYVYDRSAELVEVLDAFAGPTRYCYDASTNLVEVAHRGAQGQMRGDEQGDDRRELFRYDEAGNPYETGDGVPQRIYGVANQIVRRGDTRYFWDERGRLQEKRLGQERGAYHNTWTDDGMLASVTCPDGRSLTFSYDPFGRRMLKQIFTADEVGRPHLTETVRFVWDGDQLVHEIKTRAAASGDPVLEERTYCFDDGGFMPLAQRDGPAGSQQPDGAETGYTHYITDPVGAPEQLVDSAGRVVCTLERTVWGAAAPAGDSTASTPFRFQGQYADDETGLHYNRFRYYDPRAGFFISPDPIGLEGGVHAYRYGRNPTHWIDPLGLAVNTPGTGVVYLRRDPVTLKEYVGKSKSVEAYKERRKVHDRALQKKCPGTKGYGFDPLQTGFSGEPALSQAEEDWIRAGGGPGGKPGQTGGLENKMHGQAKGKYKGIVPFP